MMSYMGMLKEIQKTRRELEQILNIAPVDKNIIEAIRTLTHAVHANAVDHGWHREDRGTEPLLLMHSEISEAVEALRDGNPESVKIPGHSHVAEELADVIIRVLDYCGKHEIDIGRAILAKHRYNIDRPYRHGGKAF
jgi:NTP pyrophosphatase (non-canonical NTP hydrolase)